MKKEENCKKCGKLLLEVVPLQPDGKYWAMREKTALELQSDGIDSYYECAHCKAKNIIIEEHTSQLRIIDYKE